jgi:Fe-S oxidoreductase
MVLDEVREWLYGCTHCGTCKDVLDVFTPACPAGEKYQLESYFASGKMLIARGAVSGVLDLDDDEIRNRFYAYTGCFSCEQQCGIYHHQHIFEVVRALRAEAVTCGALNPAYMVMIEGLKKEDNVFGKPKAERGDWAKVLNIKNSAQEKVDVAYHTGCLLSFDPELWEVPLSSIALLIAAGVDVGITGPEESCCGGRACSCSDGYSTLRNLYPKTGIEMKFETLHTVEYLN